MAPATVTSILFGVVAVVFVLYRQLRTRQLTSTRVARVPLITAVIGIVETIVYVQGGGPIQIGHVVAIAVGMVIAAALAYPRAMTIKVWQDAQGVWFGQGTIRTIMMWIVTIGAHIGISLLIPPLFGEQGTATGGLESATLMLFIAVSVGLQGYFGADRLSRHQARARVPA